MIVPEGGTGGGLGLPGWLFGRLAWPIAEGSAYFFSVVSAVAVVVVPCCFAAALFVLLLLLLALLMGYMHTCQLSIQLYVHKAPLV